MKIIFSLYFIKSNNKIGFNARTEWTAYFREHIKHCITVTANAGIAFRKKLISSN